MNPSVLPADVEYLRKYNVPELLNDMLVKLLESKPDNPVVGLKRLVSDRLVKLRDPTATTPTRLAPKCQLRIIAVNDIYEHGNMAKFKTCIDENRAPNTIVTCAGDFLAPSLMSAIDKGRAMVDMMNRVGVQYVCIGNHEANVSMNDMLKRYDESKFVWINSNMPDVDLQGRPPMPEYSILEVPGDGVTKKVALLGIDTNIMTQFPKGAFGGAAILDPLETAKKYAALLKDQVDCIVPLTHLDMPDDRKLARLDLGFPIALGGHDHDLYHEIVKGQHILKLGQDATHIGIVDLLWYEDEKAPVVNVQVHDVNTYPPDPDIAEIAAGHEALIANLTKANLTAFPTGQHMSSMGVRNRATTMGTFLCTAAREAFCADGCVNRAGYIRGSYDYQKQRYFTYGDLIRETPLGLTMVVLTMPGQVIADMVKFSRTGPRIGSGDFLQIDNGMIFNEETATLTHINGKPIDLTKEYDLVVPFLALRGTIAPLITWVKANPDKVPPHEEAGMSIQCALVEYWSAAVWLQLANMHDLDENGDGFISPEELRRGLERIHGNKGGLVDLVVANVMAVADLNEDGLISMDEMLEVPLKCAKWSLADTNGDDLVSLDEFYDAAEMFVGSPLQKDQCTRLFETIDTDNDGQLTKEEIRSWIAQRRTHAIGVTGVQQKDLLVCW